MFTVCLVTVATTGCWVYKHRMYSIAEYLQCPFTRHHGGNNVILQYYKVPSQKPLKMTWINLALWGFLRHCASLMSILKMVSWQIKLWRARHSVGALPPHCTMLDIGKERKCRVVWAGEIVEGFHSPFHIHEHSGSQDYFSECRNFNGGKADH